MRCWTTKRSGKDSPARGGGTDWARATPLRTKIDERRSVVRRIVYLSAFGTSVPAAGAGVRPIHPNSVGFGSQVSESKYQGTGSAKRKYRKYFRLTLLVAFSELIL